MDAIRSYITSISPVGPLYELPLKANTLDDGKSAIDEMWKQDMHALTDDNVAPSQEPEKPSWSDGFFKFLGIKPPAKDRISVTLEGRIERITRLDAFGQQIKGLFGLYNGTNEARVENRVLRLLKYGVESNLFINDLGIRSVTDGLEKRLNLVNRMGVLRVAIDNDLSKVNASLDDPAHLLQRKQLLTNTLQGRITKHFKDHESDFRFRTFDRAVNPNKEVSKLEGRLAFKSYDEVDDVFLNFAI